MPSSHPQPDSFATCADAEARFPVVLLVFGRRCLVAGGGRIATRKVGQLLAAGARVVVVSPTATPSLLAWAHAGRITYRPRSFAAADVRGCFAAFAATDDGAANRRLLAASRRHGVFATAADANWRAGDFITPAVAADAELSIAVSTGGRSCRRAKQVRRLLQDRLDLFGACDLLAVSTRWRAGAMPPITDHRSPITDVSARWRAGAMSAGATPAEQMAARLRQVLSIHEFVVMVTSSGINLLAVVRADPEVAALIPRLLPGGLRAPRVLSGVAAMHQAVELWIADGKGGLARAAAHAQQRGWADERMRAWIEVTRQAAGRTRSGQSRDLTNEGFIKDYERLIGTFENRDAGK